MRRFLLYALIGANLLLIGAGWAMAIVAYPKLPSSILLWINLLNQSPFRLEKTPAFFLYPTFQLFLAFLFGMVSLWPRLPSWAKNENIKRRLQYLWKEEAWTALIFFNLILIHLQRSLIFLSHGLKEGFHPTYFLILFVFLFFLIPAYRLRVRLELSVIK